jgi:hypothetical protein
MKITYKSKNGRLVAEVQGETQKDVFQQIASFQEVFEETACGACSGEDLRFVVRRNAADDDFFELHCQNPKCRARLAFGQHKKGGSLFPSRKDKDGKYLDKGGWTRWNPETKKEE